MERRFLRSTQPLISSCTYRFAPRIHLLAIHKHSQEVDGVRARFCLQRVLSSSFLILERSSPPNHHNCDLLLSSVAAHGAYFGHKSYGFSHNSITCLVIFARSVPRLGTAVVLQVNPPQKVRDLIHAGTAAVRKRMLKGVLPPSRNVAGSQNQSLATPVSIVRRHEPRSVLQDFASPWRWSAQGSMPLIPSLVGSVVY